MKIVYIVNARMPTEKAHGFQIVKVCHELAALGNLVELWIPYRKNKIQQNIFEYYDIKNNFAVKTIRTFDVFAFQNFFGPFTFFLQSLWFLSALLFKLPNIKGDAVIYTRNPEIIWLARLLGKRAVYNAHSFPEKNRVLFLFLVNKSIKIVCNSHGTRKAFNDQGYTQTETIPNGVDIEEFSLNISKHEVREELGLPKEKFICMYVGHLYAWKGIDVVVGAAKILKNNPEYFFVIVGGTETDIMKYKSLAEAEKLDTILFTGHKSKELIPVFLKAADGLLLPNIPISKESEYYTSPIKMFEYMASHKPIIASRLPSIAEILNEKNASLVEPGNGQALAEAIQQLQKNPDMSKNISEQAYKDVSGYTWQHHAEKLADFLYTNPT